MFDALANLIAYQLLGLDPSSRLGAALHFFVMDTTKIFVLLILIVYAMGLLRAMLSPERVRDYVRGKPKWLARTSAITLGAMTPFCSCSSVPLFIGFVEAGIPLGVTFSFLIASPMINEVAAVILVGILGWKLAALYVVAGLTVAYAGGAVIERFRPERWVEGYVWKIQMGELNVAAPDTSLAGRHATRSPRFAKSSGASGSGYCWESASVPSSMATSRNHGWWSIWVAPATGWRCRGRYCWGFPSIPTPPALSPSPRRCWPRVSQWAPLWPS